jgi:prevent-host-death family protein
LFGTYEYVTIVMTIVMPPGAKMRIIKASEFKAKCLRIMDEVAATGEPVLITKNGVPITQLIPARHRPERIFGSMKGTFKITEDIISPIDTQWDALRD